MAGILTRITRVKFLRDCRNYYRLASFGLALTVLADITILVLSIFKFAVFDFISFAFTTCWAVILLVCVLYLKKYTNLPDSDHWMTHAQTHITASAIIAFLLFSYRSSLSAPWSTAVAMCHPSNTTDVIGNIRCQVKLVMSEISWVAPMSMLLASWIIYFSAVSATGAHPVPFFSSTSASSGRVWRHINIHEVNEGETGGVQLP